jgi:phytoene dehydrogenase-like protein
MAKKIVIIGAGIAGLSAGCYARMNGYDAEIFEAHSQPGGLCTSWQRGDYTIDGCIHWLTGSSPGNNFYKLWEELGAVQGRRMIDHDIFYRYVDRDGKTLNLYSDVDRLEAHLLELAPEDRDAIENLCRMIRRFAGFDMPVGKADELYNVFDYVPMMIRMLPYMKDLQYCSETSISDFANGLKNPFLREVLPIAFFSSDMNLVGLVMTMALLHKRAGGYPEGGSLAFSKAIEERFLGLGGSVKYNTPVERVLVEEDRAVGVRLQNGTEVCADYVISACDLRTTIYDFLGGHYMDPLHNQLLTTGELFPSSIQISYGVDMDFSDQPACVGECFRLETPFAYGSEQTEWFTVKDYRYDPTLAPEGKTVVVCMLLVEDYRYWEKLSEDKKAYAAEKKRIADAAAEVLEQRYPGFTSSIEVTDVVTPVTYTKYTGNWKGTYMTWKSTPEQSKKTRVIPKTLPELEHFYLASMWVMAPGGIPSAAKAARDVLQLICKDDRRRFKTSTP